MIFLLIFVVFFLGGMLLMRIAGGLWTALTTWPLWVWGLLAVGLVLVANFS